MSAALSAALVLAALAGAGPGIPGSVALFGLINAINENDNNAAPRSGSCSSCCWQLCS